MGSDYPHLTPRMRQAVRVRNAGFRIAALGLLGIGVGRMVGWMSGLSETEQVATPMGRCLAWFFSGALSGSIFILLPISSLLRRRALRTQGMYQRGVPIPPDDLEVPEPELPPWLGWPIWVVVTAGSLFLIYVLVFYSLPQFFARG